MFILNIVKSVANYAKLHGTQPLPPNHRLSALRKISGHIATGSLNYQVSNLVLRFYSSVVRASLTSLEKGLYCFLQTQFGAGNKPRNLTVLLLSCVVLTKHLNCSLPPFSHL